MKAKIDDLTNLFIGHDFLSQVVWDNNEVIDFKKGEVELEVLINGVKVKNPLKFVEIYNKEIESYIDNTDEILEDLAKNLIRKKYSELEDECMELLSKVRDLKEEVEGKIG